MTAIIAAEKVKVVFGCDLGAKRKVSFPIDFSEYKSSTREWKPSFKGVTTWSDVVPTAERTLENVDDVDVQE